MQNFYHLDQLIHGYFNQDYDLINDGADTIEGIIGLFKKTAPGWLLK
ncbi:TPA: contact-dependent growth inhibition system immunity protein, partial [Enterobacter cloacae]